jgi:hypothetical protein
MFLILVNVLFPMKLTSDLFTRFKYVSFLWKLYSNYKLINVKEYRRGNQKRTTQRNWQLGYTRRRRKAKQKQRSVAWFNPQMPRAHIIQYLGCFYHWVDIHLMEEYYSPRVLPNSSQCFCTDMFFNKHFVYIYIDLYNISISWIWLSCLGPFGMFLLSRIF